MSKVWGEEGGDAVEVVGVGVVKGGEVAAVDVEHGGHSAGAVVHGHDNLAARERTAGDMARELLDVGHNDGLVAFKDMSNDEVFITRSTVNTKETIDIDGVTYPLVKLEITSSSHPFFTGKQKLVDTAGRIDKFLNRYGNRKKK